MINIRSLLMAFGLTLAAPLSAAPAVAPAVDHSAIAPAPRILVMLKLGPEHFRSGSSYAGAYGDTVGQAQRLRFARRLARDHGLTIADNWPMAEIGIDCVIMTVADGRTAEAAAAEMSGLRGVEWAQPINEFAMQGASAPYNDRLSAAQPAISQWHLTMLHCFATGRGQTIAIIDSRIDTTHPDFVGQDIEVSDFVPGNSRVPEHHGTGVAGIISARANNGVGIAGIAPGARILGLHACWEQAAGGRTVCDSLSLAKAMSFALDHHADVINLSLSGPRDRLIETLVSLGIARGMTVVAAVDQSHLEQSFPASIKGVLAVIDERLPRRQGGAYVAPGRDVPTTEPEGKWSLVNGSSYAAAHLSGLAALLRQLSASRGAGASTVAALGPRGTIDAGAAVARVSALNLKDCRSRD